MPKQKKPSSSSKATARKPYILSDGTPAKALRGSLTLEEQRALGIDTGPVMYMSPVPRRSRPPKPPKEEV
jgi:hypothetical protein